MGKIKKVRFSTKRLLKRNDRFDRAFWDEFLRLEEIRSNRGMFQQGSQGKLVTITIKDEESGEEWVIEKVRLLGEKGKRLIN